jgi:hypothetical protein
MREWRDRKPTDFENVKVCSLYGDGFYYIPGTQTCMKIGGFLRTEWDVNAGASFTTFTNGTNAQFTRAGDQLTTRARGVITMDVREQTTWGTLRAYLAGGWNYTSNDAPTISLPGTQVPVAGGGGVVGSAPNGASNTYLLRAFIQLGGFTFGKTASFYDFFNTSKYTYQTNFIYQDYAGIGVNIYGYTQLLGNGVAATVSVQDPTQNERPIVDLTNGVAAGSFAGFAPGAGHTIVLGAAPTNDAWQNGGFIVPDIVFNVRVDQAWGGAQVAALLHDDRARYYNTPLAAGAPVNGLVPGVAHPGDKWGWAVSGGLELNLPWAKGDSFAVQSQYCVGDTESCYAPAGTRLQDLAWNLVNNNNKIGFGWVDDAFFANTAATGGTGLQLSTMWNIFAAIQHYWVPDVRTSLYGGYVQYKANSSAVDTLICAPIHFGTGGTTAQPAVSATGCADWAAWQIGSRTIWNPVRNLDVGVEALYTDLSKSAFSGANVAFVPTNTGQTAPGSTFRADSTHIWSGILRIQYNFYP